MVLAVTRKVSPPLCSVWPLLDKTFLLGIWPIFNTPTLVTLAMPNLTVLITAHLATLPADRHR